MEQIDFEFIIYSIFLHQHHLVFSLNFGSLLLGSSQLIIALCLMMSGDVELNPGRLTSDIEQILSTIDGTTFEEDDWNVVVDECSSLAHKWQIISPFLGLKLSLIDRIRTDFPCDSLRCWNEALKEWIRQNNLINRFGKPSWRTLLRAIAKVDKRYFRILAPMHQVSGSESNGENPTDKPTPAHLNSNSKQAILLASTSEAALGSELVVAIPNQRSPNIGPDQKRGQYEQCSFESQHMIYRFQELFSATRKSLREEKVDVQELVYHLELLGPIKPIYKDSRHSSLRHQLEELVSPETTVDDIMSIVKDYCSFFNYQMLEHIINEFGTPHDKLKLAEYKEEFNKYAECCVVGETSSEHHTDLFVTLDDAFDNCSLSHLNIFISSLRKILKIPAYVKLRLCRIGSGSIKLTFQLPNFVQQDIFPLSSDQEAQLSVLGVMQLLCGDYQFTSRSIRKKGSLKSEFDTSSTSDSGMWGTGSRLSISAKGSQRSEDQLDKESDDASSAGMMKRYIGTDSSNHGNRLRTVENHPIKEDKGKKSQGKFFERDELEGQQLFGKYFKSGATVVGKGLKQAVLGEATRVVILLNASETDTCVVSGELFYPCKMSVVDPNKHYELEYKLFSRGLHQLHVKVNGEHIAKSPYSIIVKQSVSMLGTPVRIFSSPGLLSQPTSLTINRKGEIIVAEEGRQCVTIFRANGTVISSFGSPAAHLSIGSQIIDKPHGVATHDNGTIFVVDNAKHCISAFTSEGNLIKSVGHYGNYDPLQFNKPMGIDVHPITGNIYITDSENCRVQILNSDLQFISSFGSRGSDYGQFNQPQDISFDDTGDLYIADSGNHRIQVFCRCDEKLMLSKVFGEKGEKEGQLMRPSSIFVDDEYRVYVTEEENHRVSIFTHKGQFLKSFGNKGSCPGQFEIPRGIAVDKNGDIYVSDYSNNRLQVF